MSVTYSIKDSLDWTLYFGNRYLAVDNFIRFCKVVGLHGCSEQELEYYEQRGWMFPAARTIAPEDYAQAFWKAWYSSATDFPVAEKHLPFHRLDQAIRYPARQHENPDTSDSRHPIDQAWGSMKQLQRPRDTDFQPWDRYVVSITNDGVTFRQPTARHLYHYWQAYELFHVRKLHADMYRDHVLIRMQAGQTYNDLQALYDFFDAVSYFTDLYELQRRRLLSTLPPDDSGWITLNEAQQDLLITAAREYAVDTLDAYQLNEVASYIGLRGMMYLHQSYEESERIKLAEAMKTDIWHTVEFMYHAFGRNDLEIAERAGRVWGQSQNYLEVLFPNRRKETQTRATSLLVSLGEDHNKKAPSYSMSNSQIQELIDYIESTDLAWLEYVLVELNDTYFARHSWQVAARYLHLKTLASFPESLAKMLIVRNGDSRTQTDLYNQKNPGMSCVSELLLRTEGSRILSKRNTAGRWNATNIIEFTNNLAQLTKLIDASMDDEFVGSCLALATLVRNFTSHLVVEDPQLFGDHEYVQCVRAIITASVAMWHTAKAKAWI